MSISISMATAYFSLSVIFAVATIATDPERGHYSLQAAGVKHSMAEHDSRGNFQFGNSLNLGSGHTANTVGWVAHLTLDVEISSAQQGHLWVLLSQKPSSTMCALHAPWK